MPELPEVETTVQGITPYIVGQTVQSVLVRNAQLRWRVPRSLCRNLTGAQIDGVGRRAKYILLETALGSVVIHLGMSGSLRVLDCATPPLEHDHLDIAFTSGLCLRFRDPRRFGCVLWSSRPLRHRLLRDLGPEPLEPGFDGNYLFGVSRRRSGPVKSLLMNARVVSGIGNIYASEALFAAGIHPQRAANRISLKRYRLLADAVKQVLKDAIRAGGTTLRDYHSVHGQPGYFSHALGVYDRAGEPCLNCGNPIRRSTQQQRSTFYCPHCQR